MDYVARIRQERSNMSKSFAKLADYLLDSYVESAFMTASELAHTLNLDAATVVRFSQYLGYAGFPELQQEIRERVKDDLLRRPVQAEQEGSVPAIAAAAMRELAIALEHTRISLDTNDLERLAERIGEVRRIIILAEGPAQPNAYSLVQYLEQGGFPVYIARAGIGDLARTINTATPQDLILAMEVSGHSPYITRALSEAEAKGIPTAAIIGAASLASARCANIVVAAQAHDSMGVAIVSLEAIIYTLAQVLRWRYAERFAGTEQAIAELSERIQQPLD
ncbi:MAG: MurR/RpiR family transcriptional regulator [Anaerolineales bacterium]|nr:MurR/RpiR family transcriptional regulator [Anaerolineales bacterium]MDD5469056.1 MurR/RpiR family transcriptional regulator [Anaerolineales bacterium]